MMQSMPPLEHPNQEIQIDPNNESKHDTQQLANKDVFEISHCSDYDEAIGDFVRNIVSNNKCGESFCDVIRYLNPLSHRDAMIFAKHLQNKADLITIRGWNVIKLCTNIDETSIVCYLIEYAHYARDLLGSKDKKDKKDKHKHKKDKHNDGKNENFRKKIFDKLNNDVRSKLKLNALSLDVLSLIITVHFVSSLSSKSDGFLRSLLSSYLPSYLTRFPMNGTHFMRLFDSVVYHRKHFHEKKLLQQLFDCVNQHIEFVDSHIIPRQQVSSSTTYDHLFPMHVIFYIVKESINIGNKPQSLDRFIIDLTCYAMNKYNKCMNGAFVCLMLNVYHKYWQELPSHHCECLYDLCIHLWRDCALNIGLLSQIMMELEKLKYLNKFIKFIADDKAELNEIIKRSMNVPFKGDDEELTEIKSAFVCITVQIAKQFTEQSLESTTLLSICAKSMIKFDEKSKNVKRSTIFNKTEFQKLIWCFGFAKYRNDNFWKDLYGKVKKLNGPEIDNEIITKFSWSIARVKSYLSKHKKDNLIHGPMIWCIKNCVELISKQGITTVFSLEQISTICWSISICGKPGTQIENNYNDRALKYYVKLFDSIVNNTWEIVDFTLSGKPQYYMNILSAMLTYKDELLAYKEIDNIKDKVIEFVIHVLNQFNISERGEHYMKEDPNIIDFLLHIAAEFRQHVVEKDNMENNKNNNNESMIPDQMIKQINKMLQYLMQLKVEITHECAFSIACTLSRIPYNEELITNKHKVLNRLCNLIIRASLNKEKRRNKEYLMLDYTLGLCSAICTHSSEPNNENINREWDHNVMSTLLKSAKYYLFDQKDKWSQNHFLLKNHLKYFIDKFDKNTQILCA